MNTDMFKQELNTIGGGCFGGGAATGVDAGYDGRGYTCGSGYGNGLAVGAGSVHRGHQGRGYRYDSSSIHPYYICGAHGDGKACGSGTWKGTSGYNS